MSSPQAPSRQRLRGAIAIVAAVPLTAAMLAGCGGSGSSEAPATSATNTSAPSREAAAASFTIQSQSTLTLASSKYSSGDWEAGASPASINGLSVTANQPVGVPLASKGGKEATFVLTVAGVRTKVLIKGSTCIGFSGDYYGYSPERGIGTGSRITCTGQGFSIAATDQF